MKNTYCASTKVILILYEVCQLVQLQFENSCHNIQSIVHINTRHVFEHWLDFRPLGIATHCQEKRWVANCPTYCKRIFKILIHVALWPSKRSRQDHILSYTAWINITFWNPVMHRSVQTRSNYMSVPFYPIQHVLLNCNKGVNNELLPETIAQVHGHAWRKYLIIIICLQK